MGDHHYTKCTNDDCREDGEGVEPGSKCKYCREGKRERDPDVKSLLVKKFDDDEIVSVIPVKCPEGSVRGERRLEVVMTGLMRKMDLERFYIDDSEFDEIVDA